MPRAKNDPRACRRLPPPCPRPPHGSKVEHVNHAGLANDVLRLLVLGDAPCATSSTIHRYELEGRTDHATLPRRDPTRCPRTAPPRTPRSPRTRNTRTDHWG